MPVVRGDRVKSLRETRGLDIATFAKRVGAHVSYLYRLEANQVENASAIMIAQVAKVLDTSIEHLVDMTDEPGRFAPTIHDEPVSERTKAIALRIDALPEDRKETVQAMFENLLFSVEDSAVSSESRKRKLLTAFESLGDRDREFLLSEAELLQRRQTESQREPANGKAQALRADQ